MTTHLPAWSRRPMQSGCALLAAAVLSGVGLAQDTRTVTEPMIPPVCTTLKAGLFAAPDANGGKLAEADEHTLDTARIQAALDGCGPGKAVELALGTITVPANTRIGTPARNAFLSGPLELREGVTLLVDAGVTVYGSRDPRVYEIPNPDAKPGDPIRCGTSMPRPATFPAPLAQSAPARRGGCRSLLTINVKSAGLMGEGTIDGRGYAQILGKSYSWWQQARKAQPNDDLYFNPRLITASHADGLIFYRIHLNNSPNFHVGVNNTDGFTAWGVHLQTPVNKALLGTDNDARNTDGIDPGFSQNVTVAHSWIDNGDDNIAIKAAVIHMSVLDNHFYNGHGMSIGSETTPGQSFLLVDGLTEDHTTSGIRIKSNVKRGGPVHDLVYKNICMRDVPIPIAISPYYTNQTVEPFEDPKYTGDKIPDYKRITLENIYSATAGDVLMAGLDDAHRTTITIQNVWIEGITPAKIHAAYADIMVNPPGSNIQPPNGGTVKSIRMLAMKPPAGAPRPMIWKANQCDGKFAPYQ